MSEPFYKTSLNSLLLIMNLALFIMFCLVTVLTSEHVGKEAFAPYETVTFICCLFHIVALFIHGLYVLATTKEL